MGCGRVCQPTLPKGMCMYLGHSSLCYHVYSSVFSGHILVVQTDFVCLFFCSLEANWLPLRMSKCSLSRELSCSSTCSLVRLLPKRNSSADQTNFSRLCSHKALSIIVRKKLMLLSRILKKMCGPF